MNITISSSLLRDAFSKILSTIDKRNTRPILSYTLLEVTKNEVILTSTNLEISSKIVLKNVTVKSEGTLCVNGKNIFEILKLLPEKEINFVKEDNSLNITCENINYSLLIYNSEEFPKINFKNISNTFEIDNTTFSNILKNSLHSISNDETRIHLNGVFFHLFEGSFRAVSTDGHRLFLIDTEVEQIENQYLKME